MYTTISDASSEVNGEAEVTPSQVNNGYTATELTITTSLVTNKNLGTISAMIGNVACEDIELVTNNPVTITCTLPAGLVGGKYNVVLNIPNLGKSYTIENGFEVSPQVTANVASSSTGYGTISNNGFIAPYGTPITTNGNTIIIGDQTITATPTAQTVQYDYAFANWTNNCGATVTANCTISANFTRTTRSYTVTFVAGPSGYGTASRSSQTVVYGESVSVSGATATVAGTATTATPAAQTAQYTYAFSNWTNNCGATVTGNCTITANFTRTTRSYTVTFAVNTSGYGTTSRSSQTVTYGGAVSVSGATATVAGTATTATPAAQTAQYTYAFASWTNNCGATVTGNCTITANFTRTTRSYTVTFATSPSSYGTVSRSSQTVTYGGAVSTSGATVTVAGTATTATPAAQTAQYTYAFSSWTNNCGATVTGNCTISANFTRTTRSYTITWNANGGSVSPTTTTKEYGTALGTLPTPTYTGYNFGGWFTAASGGSQIATTTTVTGNVTYYAHWTPINLSNITNMQQMTSSICANTATNTSKQLVDTRDNKLYWVTKLADGNCWMTQNLDYDIVKGNNIIASMTSYSTTTWNAPRATQTNYFGNETATETYSYDHGNYYLPDGSGSKTAITCTTSSNGGANCHYHLGNLYQFNAAAGGTAQSSGDSTYSICPAGWRLPERNSSATKGLPNLLSKYSSSQANDNILLASPLYFVRSGNDDWSISSVGRIGYIWTGYGGSSSLADYFYYSSGYVRNATVGRYQGFSVRCVAI